jgi:tRNA G18 (ribose-2'-O)-methylase SpoU
MASAPIAITCFDDPRVDPYRNVRDADLRGRDDLFMAESELVIRRLLRTPERLHSLLLSPRRYEKLHTELEGLPDTVPVYVAELQLMHEIAAFHIHRGVLAAGIRPRDEQLTVGAALGPILSKTAYTLVAAEGITNVDNMGALFRNAAAFGVAGILLDPTCCDPLYRKAIRVSMGHTLSIPYAISHDWSGDLERMKREWGIGIIGAEPTEAAIPLWQLPRSDRMMYIFGSEGHGLSRHTLKLCDAVCAIPMSGDVPSLNVAVASAVVLYEKMRGANGQANA